VVQDGDSEDSMFHAPEEGLPDVCGSEGRFSACVDRPFSPQVSPICLAGQDIPVQDAPIRPFTVAPDLHQDSPPITEMGEKTRDSTLGVPGRSLDHGEFEREISSGHTPSDGQAAVPWLLGQHGEVTAGTIADSGPPRLHVQHEGHDTGSSQVQATGHSSRGNEDSEQGMDLDQELVIVRRQSGSDDSSSVSSSSHDSRSTSPQERSIATTRSLMERHGPPRRRGGRELAVVDHAPQGLERDDMGAITLADGRLHGRLGHRLGNSRQPPDLERLLVWRRQSTAHQLEGAPDDQLGSDATTLAGQGGEFDLRQHRHHCVHQQVWRHEVSSTYGAGRQDLETLSSHRHTAQDDVCSFSIQSSGCTLAQDGRAAGMEHRPGLFPPSGPDMGPAPHGSLCLSPEPQVAQ
ncbi:hypothetical protein EC968_009460, partial [Mortierella alpina]